MAGANIQFETETPGYIPSRVDALVNHERYTCELLQPAMQTTNDESASHSLRIAAYGKISTLVTFALKFLKVCSSVHWV
ncbi:hypothetical protein FRC12_001362 [Ceratobasidium sp. 428]|nr:hypothetical protein FRC12_001362 [Ceratobasidium sp. 428]